MVGRTTDTHGHQTRGRQTSRPCPPPRPGRPQRDRRLQLPRRPRATRLDPGRDRPSPRTAPGPAAPPSQHLRHRTRLRRRPPPGVRRPRNPRLRPRLRPPPGLVLPPPARDHRTLHHTTNIVSELYGIVFGREDQLEPVYDRLRQLGIDEPTEVDRTIENLTGRPSRARQTSYRERRKQLLLALLDQYTDEVDRAAEEIGTFFDHLRQVGIRGLVAERLNDGDYVGLPPVPEELAEANNADKDRSTQPPAAPRMTVPGPPEKSATTWRSRSNSWPHSRTPETLSPTATTWPSSPRSNMRSPA